MKSRAGGDSALCDMRGREKTETPIMSVWGNEEQQARLRMPVRYDRGEGEGKEMQSGANTDQELARGHQ